METKVALLELQPRSITLQRGREPGYFEGSYTLGMTNSRGVGFAARVEVRAEGEAKAEWISVPSEHILFNFAADRTEPVAIKVRVPETFAGKTFSFSVRVMDKANPDELFDKISGDLVVPAADKPPPARARLPRWLLPVIAGGVLLLAGGAVFAVKALGGPNLGDACDPAKPKCPDGIGCHPAKKQCLAAVGQECHAGSDCVSAACGDDGKCARLALGADCDPAAPSLCAERLECSKSARKCLGAVGAACKLPADCTIALCTGGKCAPLPEAVPVPVPVPAPEPAPVAEPVPAAPPSSPVVCSVLDDGYTNLSPPGDAIFLAGPEHACVPDGTSAGNCRRWFGRCTATSDKVDVKFVLFNDGQADLTPSSDVVLIRGGSRACVPDGSADGACRKWFGPAKTRDGRTVECFLFDNGYNNLIGPTTAIYYRGPNMVCMPDGTAGGACRRWFGRCQTR